jgi:hypothetical protein
MIIGMVNFFNNDYGLELRLRIWLRVRVTFVDETVVRSRRRVSLTKSFVDETVCCRNDPLRK